MANLVEVFNEPTGCSSGACIPEASERLLEFNTAVECLPLILIDGEIVSYGEYPSPEELAAMAG